MVWHLHDRLAADYMNPAGARLMRTVARRFDAVIANSRETLRTLELPAVGRPLRAVIAYPIEAGAAATRRADVGVRDITVGMVGRLTAWKGQHVFLRAFKRAFPDGGCRAVIVGAPLFGEDEYEAHLRRLVGSLGLDDRVEFAGFQEDIPAQLARFDILVHASVIPEPFGQVVLEGMAAGLPVVASGAGGPSEVITDGRDGFLFEPGESDGLAAVLRRLAADPSLRERVGTAARARARDFAPDVIAGQLIPVYLNVLGRAG
jgi:glycosyltransferase involved in cell wall biosynthesis